MDESKSILYSTTVMWAEIFRVEAEKFHPFSSDKYDERYMPSRYRDDCRASMKECLTKISQLLLDDEGFNKNTQTPDVGGEK